MDVSRKCPLGYSLSIRKTKDSSEKPLMGKTRTGPCQGDIQDIEHFVWDELDPSEWIPVVTLVPGML